MVQRSSPRQRMVVGACAVVALLGVGLANSRSADAADSVILGNRVWEDTNGDGRQDSGEPGIDGAIVRIYSVGANGDSLVGSQTTGSGWWEANLSPGCYRIRVEAPEGYTPTLQNVGSGRRDSDISKWGHTHRRCISSDYYTLDAGFVPPANPEPPRVSVSLTFDDALPEHVLAGNLLAERGAQGTFYVNTARLGSPGHFSAGDMANLAQQGHEIGGHTLDHLNLTNLSESAATAQVCDDRNNLVNLGYNPTSFAYPFGANNPTTEAIVAGCGYTYGRDVGGLRAANSCFACPEIQVAPAPKPLVLRTNGSVRVDTTLDEMKTWVEQAEATGLTGTVPVIVHRLCDNGCDTFSTTQATLEGFMDWLIERGIPMRTLTDALTPVEGAPA